MLGPLGADGIGGGLPLCGRGRGARGKEPKSTAGQPVTGCPAALLFLDKGLLSPLREGDGACGEARAVLRQHPHLAQRHPPRPRRWCRRRRPQGDVPFRRRGQGRDVGFPPGWRRPGSAIGRWPGSGTRPPSPPRGMPWRRGRMGAQPTLFAPKRPLPKSSDLFEKGVEGALYPLTAVGPNGGIRGLPSPSPLHLSRWRGSTGP